MARSPRVATKRNQTTICAEYNRIFSGRWRFVHPGEGVALGRAAAWGTGTSQVCSV